MPTYTAKTRSIGHRPRSKRLRELGGTVVRQIEGGEGGTADLSGCELLSNKVTAVTAESTDEQYPTAKLLFDLYTAIGLTLQALQNDKANTAYVDTQLGSLTSSIASIAGALQGKADANHQHAVSDVTNLQQALNYKSDVQHTHLIADLTNAAALFTQFALNSGVVSLTVGGQQRSITLPTAATPSGDPMHYVYEKLGCSYNAETGLWTYRDLDDLTTEQVNNAYVYTFYDRENTSKAYLYYNRGNTEPEANIRFNFAPRKGRIASTTTVSLGRFCQNNIYIEHVYLATTNEDVIKAGAQLQYTCAGCSALIAVHCILDVTTFYYDRSAGEHNPFAACPKLEYLRIKNLNQNVQGNIVHWGADKALSLDSVVFTVVNANNSTAQTIILHTNAMARCTADTAEYTYQGNTYTGIVALAAARGITLTDVLPS